MDVYSSLTQRSGSEGRFFGVALAIVTNNQDPENLGRVKVKLPWLADDLETDWARMVSPMAGAQRGVYFLPEVDDEVVVAFEHGNLASPYVLGALWNGKDKPPETNGDGKNNLRTIKSRSGHVVRLTDTDGEEKIEIIDMSRQNSIVVSSKDNTITITAESDVSIQSHGGKLKLRGKGIEITSQGAVQVEASGGMDLKSQGELNVSGKLVNIN